MKRINFVSQNYCLAKRTQHRSISLRLESQRLGFRAMAVRSCANQMQLSFTILVVRVEKVIANTSSSSCPHLHPVFTDLAGDESSMTECPAYMNLGHSAFPSLTLQVSRNGLRHLQSLYLQHSQPGDIHLGRLPAVPSSLSGIVTDHTLFVSSYYGPALCVNSGWSG